MNDEQGRWPLTISMAVSYYKFEHPKPAEERRSGAADVESNFERFSLKQTSKNSNFD